MRHAVKTCTMFNHLICHRWWTAVNLPHRQLILAVICPIKNRWSAPKSHRTWSLTSGCANLAPNVVQWPTYHFLLRRSFLPQTHHGTDTHCLAIFFFFFFFQKCLYLIKFGCRQRELTNSHLWGQTLLTKFFKMKNTHGVVYSRKVTILIFTFSGRCKTCRIINLI